MWPKIFFFLKLATVQKHSKEFVCIIFYSFTYTQVKSNVFFLLWEPVLITTHHCINKILLLYRYWWNTRIFPFTKKSYLHRAQWRYHFYLSRVKILVSPWLLTWLASYKRAMNKKSCVLCSNFISIYIINRTFHGRLGIQILSSRAKSISHSFASLTHEIYFKYSKIKFVSPRGHEISSIYTTLQDLNPVLWKLTHFHLNELLN